MQACIVCAQACRSKLGNISQKVSQYCRCERCAIITGRLYYNTLGYRFLSRCADIQFDNGLSSVGTEEMTKMDLEGIILVFPTSKCEEIEKHLTNLMVCLLN